MEQKRKYWIKQTWIFNLESMHDKLWCIEDDLREGASKISDIIPGMVDNSRFDSLAGICNN